MIFYPIHNAIPSVHKKIPRACILCSKFSYQHNLCDYCAGEIYSRREPIMRRDRDLVVKSLFAWRRDGLPALRKIVLAMKGHEDPEDWKEFALWMTELFKTRRKRVLIPIPSQKANHALGLARALGRWTDWTVIEALEVAEKRDQKTLSREERRSVRFDMKSELIGKEFTGAVIVDDIVTTGATAQAAFHALGSPKGTEVWCLMDRRPCGDEGALL